MTPAARIAVIQSVLCSVPKKKIKKNQCCELIEETTN